MKSISIYRPISIYRLSAIIFLAIFLLSILIYTTYTRSLKLEDKRLILSKQASTLNLEINQSIFLHQVGVYKNYDHLNHQLFTLEKIQQQVNKITSSQKLNSASIADSVDIFSRAVDKKIALIEQFKSHHALFRNSSNFFHTLSQEILSNHRITDTIKLHINQLQKTLLNNRYKYSESSAQLMSDSISELKNLSTHAPLKSNKQLNLLIKHAQLFFLHGNKTKSLVELMTAPQVLQAIVSLENVVSQHYMLQHNKSIAIQKILFLLLSMASIYIVFLLFNLAKQSQKLNQVLLDLKNQQLALNQHAIVSAADVKGNITYVNEKLCKISGYTEQELMGNSHRMLNSGFHDKDFFNSLWKTLIQGKVWHGEIKNKTKQGVFYWVSATIVPFFHSTGKSSHYIAIRTDITLQKRLEEQLLKSQSFMDKLTNSMAQGVYAIDTKGLCTFWNKGAERILDWSASELMEKNIHSIIHFQDIHGNPIASEQSILQKSIVNNTNYSSDKILLTHKNGKAVSIEITAVPLTENNQVIGSVAVFSDISQRLANEQLLQGAIKNAEQASQAKSEFLANMSHEIRTPMNGIIGMTDLALDTSLDKEQKEYLEIVKSSSLSLLNIINDILDFSKIEAGKLDFEYIEFELSHLLNETIKSFNIAAKQKNLILTIQMPPVIPFTLVGDPGRLRQILTNLIGNAIKFTQEGEVKLTVSIQIAGNHKTCLQFDVSDTGIGISEHIQESIFNAFSQADNSVSREYGGTGLGLSISSQLIHLMGGEIWLRSIQGKGSTFSFTAWFDFPVQTKEINDLPSITGTINYNSATDNDLSEHLKILVAEDNPINQKLTFSLLTKKGHKVVIAVNGIEAVDQFKQQQFDIILMDFQMPEMDGIEATQRIRSIEASTTQQQTPIIAMTANAMKEDKDRAFSAGMNDYISKPIDVKELFSTIGKYLIKEPIKDIVKNTSSPIQVCNWDASLKRLANDTELLEMMASMFIDESNRYLKNINDAYNSQNFIQFEQEIHTLKGVCTTLTADKVEQLLKSIESIAPKKQWAEIKPLLVTLEQEIEILIEVLKTKLANHR
ncbi:MAG: PAS domain S-box protein [Methylococcales bacterium]|nr:PAS domain S-box protein [Methylococcales bacterium]